MAPDGSEIETAAILTTSANDRLMPIHHRMPVVVLRENHGSWLNLDERDMAQVQDLMRPADNEFFRAEPVEMERKRPTKPTVQSPPPFDQLDLF